MLGAFSCTLDGEYSGPLFDSPYSESISADSRFLMYLICQGRNIYCTPLHCSTPWKAAKEGGQWWPLPVIGTNFLIRSLPPPSQRLAPMTPNLFSFICVHLGQETFMHLNISFGEGKKNLSLSSRLAYKDNNI